MNVFQVLHKYDAYIPHFEQKYKVDGMSYEQHRKALIKDRFYGLHLLKPILDIEAGSFYTMWNYEKLQLKWAKEKGWAETDLKKILFAQIEELKPDVFYNASPFFFSNDEIKNQIHRSIRKLCWSASPYDRPEIFLSYESRLTNLPLDVKPQSECGYRNDLFNPAYDPFMADFEQNQERPIDLFFYGQYADDAFKKRNESVERLLKFRNDNPQFNIKIRLQYRKETAPVVNIPYIRRYWHKTVYPPKHIRKSRDLPTYGLDLYNDLSRSKIVFNAGVDFTKNHKVNMRNFEVLGCGAHMLTDEGIYPDNFVAGQHFTTYKNIDDCIVKIKELLDNDEHRVAIANQGNEMVRTFHNKQVQWENFQKIVSSLS